MEFRKLIHTLLLPWSPDRADYVVDLPFGAPNGHSVYSDQQVFCKIEVDAVSSQADALFVVSDGSANTTHRYKSYLWVCFLKKCVRTKMARVKALYSYAYDYEGSKISFKCGDEFQLLAKVNNDWWHVRRWIQQGSQDIYIPAVYVKEVGEDTDPLYQNTAELRKQMEEFKKKESSTPPPPTARKPKHDRTGSEKNKAVARQDVPLGSHAPENKPETGSVADRAKKLVENLQAKKTEEEDAIPRTGSVLVPKRSLSTRRDEGASSPQKSALLDGGAVSTQLTVASKPRSRSINVRPGERKEEDSVNLTNSHRADSPAGGKSLGKVKLPPPVLPKVNKSQHPTKLNRPKSMVMISPTEGQSTEEPFSSALQSQLTEQLKQRSVSCLGSAATAAASTGDSDKGGEQSTSSQPEARLHTTTTSKVSRTCIT